MRAGLHLSVCCPAANTSTFCHVARRLRQEDVGHWTVALLDLHSARIYAQMGIKKEASETPDLRASSSPASHLGASAQSETSRAAAASPSGCRAESVPAVPKAEHHSAVLPDQPQVRSLAVHSAPHRAAQAPCTAPDVSHLPALARAVSMDCMQRKIVAAVPFGSPLVQCLTRGTHGITTLAFALFPGSPDAGPLRVRGAQGPAAERLVGAAGESAGQPDAAAAAAGAAAGAADGAAHAQRPVPAGELLALQAMWRKRLQCLTLAAHSHSKIRKPHSCWRQAFTKASGTSDPSVLHGIVPLLHASKHIAVNATCDAVAHAP